jgi:hypothetical protein
MRAAARAAITSAIETTLPHAPLVAELCAPFEMQANNSFTVNTAADCAAFVPPRVPLPAFQVYYSPLVCSANDTAVFVPPRGGETAAQAAQREADNRKYCVAIGKPLSESDFATVAGQVEAVGVRCHMPYLQRPVMKRLDQARPGRVQQVVQAAGCTWQLS